MLGKVIGNFEQFPNSDKRFRGCFFLSGSSALWYFLLMSGIFTVDAGDFIDGHGKETNTTIIQNIGKTQYGRQR